MPQNQKTIQAEIDVQPLLEGYDVESMFANEYISKLCTLSDEFNYMVGVASDHAKKPVISTPLLHQAVGLIWDKHKELTKLINPYITPIIVLNDMVMNSEPNSFLEKAEDVLAVKMLHSIYINHFDKLINFVGMTDFLIDLHQKESPELPTPEVLVRNIMPTMHTLKAESEDGVFNVFYELLKGMVFQPMNLDFPAVSVLSEIKPDQRKKGIIEYLNSRLSHRGRLMGYQLVKDATQEAVSLFKANDFPKVVYVDRVVGDGKVIYKIFMCPPPLEQFQSHLRDFGVRVAEDSIMYEWEVDDDNAVFENWMEMCESVEGMNDSHAKSIKVNDVHNCKSVQMMNIVHFMASNFEFFYFNGFGLYQNNMAEDKMSQQFFGQDKPVRFS